MNTLLKEKTSIIEKKNLTDYFKSGFKNTQKIGLEYEKIPVCDKNCYAPEFFFQNGILDFLNAYRDDEKLVPYFENNVLLGLFSNMGTISLEPGSQVEYSLKPQEDLSNIKDELIKYNNKTSDIASKLGISFLALGVQPVSTYQNIKILPKKRYEFMTKYLKTQGTLPYVMMRETAGIQVSIDYKNEEDAIRKLSCALKLSPFLTAFFVNSPIRNGKLTGYKSFRANAWLNTDARRCGLISKKLIENPEDFSFKDYADILLDIPSIFYKNNYVGDKTFRDLMQEERVELSDWLTQISLFFPDVRLKNYIEIRNHDCQKTEYVMGLTALYKGIFYSNSGIDEINELFSDFIYFDFEFVRHNAPKYGLDFKVKNKTISQIVKDIFHISRENLKIIAPDEVYLLDSAINLLEDNLTPADIIIKNFDGAWNKNIEKLIKFSKIN